jgi:hypothetical protein
MAISISLRKIISIYMPLILCWIINFRMEVKTTFPTITKFGITNFAGSVPGQSMLILWCRVQQLGRLSTVHL